MLKTHFQVKVPFSTETKAACGRGQRTDTNPFRTDCRLCQNTDAHILALDEAKSARHAAIMAQPAVQRNEPWHTEPTPMVCKNCGNDTFRMGDRTCHGHYQDYLCGKCGEATSRLTETGMSF